MATKKPARKAAPSLDVKALSAELGATVKEGKVVQTRGAYYLQLGAKKLPIPVGTAVRAADLAKLVGQSVPVAVAGSSIISIGRNGPRCYMILCYKPAPDVFGQINDAVRATVLQQLAQTGKIEAGLAQQITEAKAAVQLLG